MKRLTNEQYRAAANRLYHDEGTLEVDDRATISTVENDEENGGLYVQAWVWVPYEEAKREKQK